MLTICKPLISVPGICLVRSITLLHVRPIARSFVQQKVMSQALSSKSMLEDQAFGGDLLNRSVGDRRDADFVKAAFDGSASLLITGRSVLAQQASGSNGSRQHTELCWLSPEEIAEYGITPQTDSQTSVTDQEGGALVPYLLGRTKQETWSFAIDASAYSKQEQLHDIAKQKGFVMQDLRSMVAHLSGTDLAVAGHAVALAGWHQANGFCGRCGAPTVPIEAGAKRCCTKDKKHRLYPRTDPVAIMLVESVDGSKVLLGRAKTIRHESMLTCLSGFVEQVETIEEACRREVMEEAGISVGPVHIAGSQPWPMGRGGTCELMIGCIAKATSDTLHMDQSEMDDVRWVSRDQLQTAVEDSQRTDTPYQGGSAKPTEGVDFWIPPPTAIAHHLIKSWADRQTSWFSKL
ncbi:hypothetical protein ABBQ32_002249 [Trebouxia sp. C0010 RCD-2024]